MRLTGRSIIGYHTGSSTGAVLDGVNPSTGEILEPPFYSASETDLNSALELAAEAFLEYSRIDNHERAWFLRSVADNLMDFGDCFVDRAVSESGLTVARVRNERERTCFQLHFFANMVADGSWVDARIDRADSGRLPSPKLDIRSMLRPLGPVAVFCASNFPLAFSVAGGDTASVLASGNPAIVLAHYSHPGTAEFAGVAIRDAAQKHHLPDGVFSLLYDSGHNIATALVKHPAVKAVGFTGSRAGGTALMRAASTRNEPIPFYAEMSSINPVFIFPSALKSRSKTIAAELHAAATLGVGQFCTNPGVVIAIGQSDAFVSQFTKLMNSTKGATMLNQNIAHSYSSGVSERAAQANIIVRSHIAEATKDAEHECNAEPVVFETDIQTWLTNRSLQNEIFGPTTLLVRTSGQEDLIDLARVLEGNLTATVLGDSDDLLDFSDFIAFLEQKAGRIIFNGSPTGVEVCEAMVHGGPYPATSDGRSTSVGGRAILRFTRPVCYQNFPDEALPRELQEANPLRIRRIEDGRATLPASLENV
jgi:alpha-ketoglutaric semialdehyde dehydrogenase